MTSRRSELELFHALARDEDPRDLVELTDRLRRCVHWVLHRMLGGHTLFGEADEIVDDARMRLEQLRVRGFSGGAPEFKAYLYRVVVSACMDASSRHRFTVSLDAPVTLPDGDEKPLRDVVRDMVAPGLAADAVVERDEESGMIRRALDRLDERCRGLLRRFHLEGLAIRELAQLEGARQNTVEVALTRCRARLYAAFLGLYLEGSDRAGREQVTRVAQQIPGTLGRIFAAWWTENRSVLDISKEVGMSVAETKRLLGTAKLEVWRLVREGKPQ